MSKMQPPLLDYLPLAARGGAGHTAAGQGSRSSRCARATPFSGSADTGRSGIISPAIGCPMDFLLDDEDDEVFDDEDFDEDDDTTDDDEDADDEDDEEEEVWQVSSQQGFMGCLP